MISDKLDSFSLGSELIPSGYDPFLYRLRHSASHILAWAVQNYFAKEGEVIFGTGPATDDGFYYDFLLPRTFTEEDLVAIELLMQTLINNSNSFDAEKIEAEQIPSLFGRQPFKTEIVNDIVLRHEATITSDSSLHNTAKPTSTKERSFPNLTIFRVGDFYDLCRGPHLENTNDINPKAIKLLSFSSVYWKGNNERESLTRIYGTAWKTEEELKNYLWQRAEAEKRDHRKLGKQLEIFHFDESAPGMPYWLPDGFTIFQQLLAFCRSENKKYNYQEISTPIINKKSLWETSGHWDHYREDMYLVTTHDDMGKDINLAIKPMNCPNAMVVFKLRNRSYRELPLRLSDCDILHRNEASGAMHGLLRVRQFHQDDAHIFISERQIEDEYKSLLEMCKTFYSKFNMNYSFRLGTRPASYIGEKESWDNAEAILEKILDDRVGKENYFIAHGEGAFYGPKIDILMKDCLNRTWQMGTIQLDFQLPLRFGCKYIDENGELKTPVVIHRAIYGSLERFMGVLIEHTAGNLPVWLAPTQAIFIPIADRHIPFCSKKLTELENLGIRAVIDGRSERMNSKIRDAEMKKIPYLLIIGDKEIEEGTVSCRQRSSRLNTTLSFELFKDQVIQEIKNMSYNS